MKDSFSFALVSILYNAAGLLPPLCLLALPEEVQQKCFNLLQVCFWFFCCTSVPFFTFLLFSRSAALCHTVNLQAKDLGTLSSTCKGLRDAAQRDALWKELSVQDFGETACSRLNPKGGWKAAYGVLKRREQQRLHPYFRRR